jgi:hypothetical protein
MDAVELTGAEIRKLMRINKKTIRDLSVKYGITQKRVRYVREHGIKGRCWVLDWVEMIRCPL